MTNHHDGDGLRDQLRNTANQAWQPSEEADVMARALYALHFADRWLAEQVELSTVPMRGDGDQLQRRFRSGDTTVDLVIEPEAGGTRITGSVEPVSAGWAVVTASDHREARQLDEAGMFSFAVPQGPVDIVIELADGTTLTLKDVAQAP